MRYLGAHFSWNFFINANILSLNFFKNWCFLLIFINKVFNKALLAVGSFTSSWWMRVVDFAKSILTSLKLVTLSPQMSSCTSALTIILISLWKISTRRTSQKSTIFLSVWKASKKPLSWLTISMKIYNFTGMDLSGIAFDQIFIGPCCLTLHFDFPSVGQIGLCLAITSKAQLATSIVCGKGYKKSQNYIYWAIDTVGRVAITPSHL